MAERGERGRFLPGNKHEFPKGKSGNPGGRRGTRDLHRYVRSKTRDGEELIDWLLDVMLAQNQFASPKPPMKERIKANIELLQRGFGRAPITVEIGDGDGEQTVRFTMDIGPAAGGKKSDGDEAGDDGGD